MEFAWAEPYPELYKICKLFQLYEVLYPTHFHYLPLEGYLQEGPQCGLVALAMIIGSPSKELVNSLFDTAKSNNFTYNGEMFSANDMLVLARENIKKDCCINLYSGYLDNLATKEFLINGGIMLVPYPYHIYDSDKSNSPCSSNGHKAHWAVISGCVETETDFYVISRHGKVKNVALWKLSDLAISNAQLNEFSPDRKLQDVAYKLPDGGISGNLGLKEKAVMIKFS